MDISAFKNFWLGRRVADNSLSGELPQSQWYQCVSLIKEYLRNQFGISPGKWGNAIDYWTRTNLALLDRFDRVATNSVAQGDIVILNGLPGNPYGHIGIATGNQNGTQFEMLEQNGSTGNGTGTGADAIRVRLVNRDRIAGVLRPKANSNSGGVEMIANADQATKIYKMLRPGGGASPGEIADTAGKRSFASFLNDATVEMKARDAAYANLLQELATLRARSDELSRRPTEENFNALKAQVDVCNAKADEFGKQNEILLAEKAANDAASTSFLQRLGKLLRKFLP